MPELPEVEALAQFLRDHAVGAVVGRVQVAAVSAVKTVDPPITALSGRDISEVRRWGKFLGLGCSGLWLITHFSRGGWLQWVDNPSQKPPKPGRGPLALRIHLFSPEGNTPGIDITEAGTQKRLAVYVVDDPQKVPGISRLGPDALDITADQFRALVSTNNGRMKTLLTDQRILAGIGNAYSDEILHLARISPFATRQSLSEEKCDELFTAMRTILVDSVGRSVGRGAARLKAEKRSGLRVHGRTGESCPVCGTTIREVSYADRSFQYCPDCQTHGRILADRRMSRLLK